MSKQFVRTADHQYINLDFVKSIIYRKIEQDQEEIFEIILECIEGEIILGYVLYEGDVLEIINDIINDSTITCDYMTYEEALECVTRKSKGQLSPS